MFHSPAWLSSLRDGYGFEARATLIVDSHGSPRAGLPYVKVDDLRGVRTVALPFSDFCDPIGDPRHFGALFHSLAGTGSRVHVRCLHSPSGPPAPVWKPTGEYAWHRVGLSRTTDDIWDSLHASARRAIRKARAEGVEVVTADTEHDVRRFYDLHFGIRKHKYGLLAQPYGFFTAIWDHFLSRGEGALLLARDAHQILGGVLYLKWKDTLYYKFNASDRSRLGVRPNDLLVWEGLRLAVERELDWFDFGVSDRDQEGLVRYKRKYASEEGTVRRHSTGPEVPDPAARLLGEVTRMLTHPDVPDSVTEEAGDLLYRYFC